MDGANIRAPPPLAATGAAGLPPARGRLVIQTMPHRRGFLPSVLDARARQVRARLVVRASGAALGAPPFALPVERRHLRDLVDPLLQAASVEAAESTQSHRESVEFADVVVALALMALRKRMLSGAADADADLSSGKSSSKQAAAAGDQQAAPGVVAGVGPPPHGKATGSHPRR